MTEPVFDVQPVARNAAEVRERHQANREAWNQGAAAYARSRGRTLDFLAAGASNLHPIERAMLGDLSRFGRAIHLQCASGGDTLSLLNEGVGSVVGIDISDVHIDNARSMASALSFDAEFVRCDVLDVPERFSNTADLVYTGRGALNWLHDLEAWAGVVARLLKPGGLVSIFDGHPLTWLFDQDAATLVPSGIRYLRHAESSKGWPDTYIGDLGLSADELAVMWERAWPPSAVFTALRGAGLVVEHFGEHEDGYWNEFPNLPNKVRATLPLTYSFVARKPSASA
jgi:SAM-dependent methyltransferase